ncbi:MAG: 3-methyl-2-oxobutanoate dehydrogenase subunit VorB [Clostridiales bacterium]|nr:3-methyl-2-oxobutanoate dehydrogenase subunit VorB [Clostridiales bacterium]
MKKLWKGNEAVAEAAVAAGCRCFFGYPITPQNEIPEYMSWRLKEAGGHFVQAESEVSAINMVYGAAGAGMRAMTSSSSPGVSLKQEGISYIAGAELPCVVVNMMRAGPGLGGILPSQSDYFQATKGGGHGDYHMLVYAPASVQEAADLTYKAFFRADYYRNPVMILGDGMLGQMMEPAEIPAAVDPETLPKKEWAASGNNGGVQRVINSIYVDPDTLEEHNRKLTRKYEEMARTDVMSEQYRTEDAEVVLVAYGIVSRICKAAVDMLREQGVKAGLFRPITLFPFPYGEIARLADGCAQKFVAVELSCGQLIEDVKLGLYDSKNRPECGIYARVGGNVMKPEDIANYIKEGRLSSSWIK